MRKTNNHTYEKSVEERFKQEHPKLSKIIEIAISWGHDFEYYCPKQLWLEKKQISSP